MFCYPILLSVVSCSPPFFLPSSPSLLIDSLHWPAPALQSQSDLSLTCSESRYSVFSHVDARLNLQYRIVWYGMRCGELGLCVEPHRCVD